MNLCKSYTAYFAYFTYSLYKIIHWVLGNPIGAPLGWVLKGNPPMGPHQGLDPTHGCLTHRVPTPPGGGARSLQLSAKLYIMSVQVPKAVL